MPNPIIQGYQEQDYLNDPYLTGTGIFSKGVQVERIINYQKAKAAQAERSILNYEHAKGAETSRSIVDYEKSKGIQAERFINSTVAKATQSERSILDYQHPKGVEFTRGVYDYSKTKGLQFERTIENYEKSKGAEFLRANLNYPKEKGVQVDRHVSNYEHPNGVEVRRDRSIFHRTCAGLGYLEQSYLEGTYLSYGMCASKGVEFSRGVFDYPWPKGVQVERVIEDYTKTKAIQVERFIIDFEHPKGVEFDRLRTHAKGVQFRIIVYNTTNLRILCEFPSRGTSGVNWTATSTETGDFDVNNVNTDIVEERWQSAAGVTTATLRMDSEIPQGISIDTIAFLSHNFTTSATIVMQASNDPGFSPVEFQDSIVPMRDNLYYFASSYPFDMYRYWRWIITDPTNPAGYLYVGTIVAGSSQVFQGECFVDEVIRRLKHFSDKVATEGFTNVSNDRALKTAVQLDFRFLKYDQRNYQILKDIFETCRTSLKCLWVPDPQSPDRFTVFGKLTTIPDERHLNMGTDADFVSFTIEVDESL